MNRLETLFGKTGVEDKISSLKPFGARYRFDNRTWGLVVWAHDWSAAAEYAKEHCLEIDGLIVATYEN